MKFTPGGCRLLSVPEIYEIKILTQRTLLKSTCLSVVKHHLLTEGINMRFVLEEVKCLVCPSSSTTLWCHCWHYIWDILTFIFDINILVNIYFRSFHPILSCKPLTCTCDTKPYCMVHVLKRFYCKFPCKIILNRKMLQLSRKLAFKCIAVQAYQSTLLTCMYRYCDYKPAKLFGLIHNEKRVVSINTEICHYSLGIRDQYEPLHNFVFLWVWETTWEQCFYINSIKRSKWQYRHWYH